MTKFDRIPAGMAVEDKRRYLVGWLADLKTRNPEAWTKARTIEIVKNGKVIAEFHCQAGQVTVL